LTDGSLLAGDRIRAHVSFYLPRKTEGFDRAIYQAANRRYIAAFCIRGEDGQPSSFAVIERQDDRLRWLPQRIARFCKQTVCAALPAREAGLLTGLLIGDKGMFTDEDALAFRIAGLSHMVAVSGMHIAFLVGFCYLLFGRRIGTWVSIPLILLFVPIAGATPSVIRAAIMYLIAAGGALTRQEASGLNSLFVALALLLVVDPYTIASLSLQLSFAATLGLLLLSSRMQRRLMQPFSRAPRIVRRLAQVLASAVSCTVCATIFTTPILFSAFGSVSLLSLVSNLLVVGVTAVCFLGGIMLCLAAAVLPVAVPVIAGALRPCLAYILWVADRISRLPVGRIHWDDGFGVAVLAVLFASVLLWLLAGTRVRWRFVLPGVCVVVIGLTVAGQYQQARTYQVTYLPCGAGQAVILSDAAQGMTLIDCAGDGSYRDAAALVREWMRWHGATTIDTLILTAVDRGHARDLPALLDTVPVGQIWIPDGCRETKYNTELLALVGRSDAQVVNTPQTLYTGDVPVSVFPIADGKSGVQIADQVLVLHSPTQKQLAAYLDSTDTVPTAPEVVLSQRVVEDPALLAQALDTVGAVRVVISAGYGSIQTTYAGRPTESPYWTGEIVRRFEKR
ncbi:MAG: ComEC/Rec2 family competence protein, partial [Eubacteriales bacterium]|nr:ComEC/Rec2 family competence protein [Eubacteriales bacterium]